MVSIASSISAKTALKVNLVLILFLVAGGYAVTYYQQNHFNQLVTLEETTLQEELLKRGAILSEIGAKAIGKLIEEAIDNTALGVNDFFDTEYQEIPGFDPPKYHTKFDSYMDKAILALEDEFLKDPDVVFAVAVDINGYLPTHNTKYQKPPTGDKEKDKVGNRTKRIFNDPIGIKAAKNTEQGFRQIYHRDTGETMWDISSPIMVKGKHWGGFRIGLSMKTIEQTLAQFREKTDAIRGNLFNSIFALMAVILLVSILVVFFTISQAMQPLKTLTAKANELADGKIDTEIPKSGSDELGQLANVLERLRISLKKTMELLKKR